MSSRRWRDIRVIAGLVFIALAVLIGWQVIDGLADRDTAWAARVDLPSGLVIDADDLLQVPVSLGGSSAAYWLGVDPPIGQVLTAGLKKGQLVMRGGLAMKPLLGARLVTVGVEPQHSPLATKRGDVVDLYSVEEEDEKTKLVLAGVIVAQVAEQPSGLGSLASGRISLLVDPEDVMKVVDANRAGRIDLVLHGVIEPASGREVDDSKILN
jgi:hypothetical protein